MPNLNSINERRDYYAAIRQNIHQNPELGFDTRETAALVVRELKRMGVDQIEEGVAKNGVVARIQGRKKGRVIGLRADMDALPIKEMTGLDYASRHEGKMHACGHDGHTATLLLAAEYLANNRNFDGEIVLIFQPAEEGGGGAHVMVKEGVLERYEIDEVYALHNFPGLELGKFEFSPGAAMASADTFDITIEGKGGHAAKPESALDPILIAMRLVDGIYAIKSRGVAASSPLVISVTRIHAGTADNIIPETARIGGTFRTLDDETRDFVKSEIKRLAVSLPEAFGAVGKCRIHDGYPVTVNSLEHMGYAAEAAEQVAGEAHVRRDREAMMGAEDFSFFLQKCPGAYGLLGGGEGAPLHNPKYDFNDDWLPIGASWFVEIALARLRAHREKGAAGFS